MRPRCSRDARATVAHATYHSLALHCHSLRFPLPELTPKAGGGKRRWSVTEKKWIEEIEYVFVKSEEPPVEFQSPDPLWRSIVDIE